MKFTLFAPNFVHYSAGIRALYLLGEYLIDLGHEVEGVNYQDPNAAPPIGSRIKFIDSKTVQKSVCIVPETLDLKTNLPILRWVLNHPGLLGGPKCYSENQIVFYYSDEYGQSACEASIDGVAHELCIGTIEPFVNSGKPKLFDLFYEGKGVSDSSHGLDAIRLTRHWPPTRQELVWLLDRCENFYSYDDNSAINLESYMLGCNTYLRKFGEWQEYKPDRPERFLYNPERDRAAVARAVAIVEAALA